MADPPFPPLSENRIPLLVISSSTILFNSAIALLAYSWQNSLRETKRIEGVDFDPSEWMVAAEIIIFVALRYCIFNSLLGIAGFVGTVVRNTSLLRTFALGSLLDCTTLLFTILAFIIFSLTPSLSGPFADFVCSEITRGESFGVTSYLREKETKWGIRGLDIVLWGRETCEENWTWGVLVLFLGVLTLTVIRVYSTWLTWEFYFMVEKTGRKYSELDAEKGLKSDDDKTLRVFMPETKRRSSRSMTLPSSSHGRYNSPGVDKNGRPRLVLVPVFFDPNAPPQPASAPVHPHYSSSRHSSSSSSSTSPTRAPRKHSRRPSAPLSSPTPSSSSTCSSSASTYAYSPMFQQRCFSPSSMSDRSSNRSYFEYPSPIEESPLPSATGMKRSRSRSENSALSFAHSDEANWGVFYPDEEKPLGDVKMA